MPSVLITGSNRGLGLEFVRQYADAGWRVFACCRNPDAASELAALASDAVTIHALDVSDFAATETLANQLSGEGIDVLINNAGVFGGAGSFGSVNYDTFRTTLEINTLAPLRVAECFLRHLLKGEQRKLINISSKMGSIADNTSGGRYAYRASKAGLNMVNRSLSYDLSGQVTCVVFHPGWVATDMGGPSAPVQTPESVKGMISVIAKISENDTGKFFDWEGTELPW